MDLRLRGKIALVTGASKGIGLATAQALAEEGCELVLVARSAPDLDATAAAIRDRFAVDVRTIAADLSERDAVLRVAAAVDPLDILVNNAGAIPAGTLLQVDDDTWRSAWDLKVFGYIGLTRACYPKLVASGGVAVNIIGAAGEQFTPNYIAGSTGNAALMAFTRSLGAQSPRDGVRVVGINPGPVATERLERRLRARAAQETGDAERWRERFAAMAFGRPATPEEIADTAVFLASPRSSYTSGCIVTIDDPARVAL
jgi:NAD(P)-dependent dehydrogenase (short-subunit alcohol dehydrogenase family)